LFYFFLNYTECSLAFSALETGEYTSLMPDSHGIGESMCYIPSVEGSLKPYIGQSFDFLIDGIHFYKTYAAAAGFGVRLSTLGRSTDGVIKWRYALCTRAGAKNVRTKDVSPKTRRPSSRCGCDAKMVLKFSYGRYIVWKFEERHNHKPCTEDEREFLPANRKLSEQHQSFILNCARANIGGTRSHRLYSEFVGGYANVGAQTRDFKNFARDLKAYVSGRDAQMLINRLLEKQQMCPAFYFEYYADRNDQLSRIFWADAISRRNYAAFGDVICFDATYQTNK